MQWPWKRAESDLDREMSHHLETMADALQRQGIGIRNPPQTANFERPE